MPPPAPEKKQSLIDACRTHSTNIDSQEHVIDVLFSDFQPVPAGAVRGSGLPTEAIAAYLEQRCTTACADLLSNSTADSFIRAFKLKYGWAFNEVSMALYGRSSKRFQGSETYKWWEYDAQGNRINHDWSTCRLPMEMKQLPQLQPHRQPIPTPLPPNAPVQFIFCGAFDLAGSNDLELGVARRCWNEGRGASRLLIGATVGMATNTIQFAAEIAFPRDEGVDSNSVTALDDWISKVGLNQYLKYVHPTLTAQVAGLTRIDDYLATFLSTPLAPGSVVKFHWIEPRMVTQSAKTLAAIAAAFLAKSGGSVMHVEWSFGQEVECPDPNGRMLNNTFVDQRIVWPFTEAGLLWARARNEDW
ncbi:hypothetical protein JCM5353_000416 [Sporobolomyces roseus]